MDISKLEVKAWEGHPLPDGLTQPEQLLFLSLRILYREFRIGVVSQPEAEKQKATLIAEYRSEAFSHGLYVQAARRRNRISQYLPEIEKGGCEKCRLAVRILDGREPTA